MAFDLPSADAERVLRCLTDLGLPLDVTAVHDKSVLFGGMEEFRQHLGGRLTLTMLNAVGSPFDVHEVNLEVMAAAIERVVDYARNQRQNAVAGE